jgi:hypothetical protein
MTELYPHWVANQLRLMVGFPQPSHFAYAVIARILATMGSKLPDEIIGLISRRAAYL